MTPVKSIVLYTTVKVQKPMTTIFVYCRKTILCFRHPPDKIQVFSMTQKHLWPDGPMENPFCPIHIHGYFQHHLYCWIHILLILSKTSARHRSNNQINMKSLLASNDCFLNVTIVVNLLLKKGENCWFIANFIELQIFNTNVCSDFEVNLYKFFPI